jgi:hypothetical protein
MMGNGKNGRRQRVLDARAPFEEPAKRDLFEEHKDSLLRYVKTDAERELIQEHLTSFEVRPAVARLCDHLMRRATDPDDQWILDTARKFRRTLPEPQPEPPEDPQLEQLILGQTGKRDDAEAALEAVRRQLTSGLVELTKLRQKAPKADHAVLKAQLARLKEDVQEARDRAEKESGRLQQLLNIRAERRRAFLLAAATKR